jgi:hypothetical protein
VTIPASANIVISNGGYPGPPGPPGGPLTPAAVQSAGFAAAPGQLVPCNTTSGPFTVTLPHMPPDQSVIAVKIVTGTNPVTIAAQGSDTFNQPGGAATLTLKLLNQGVSLQYKASLAVWYVLGDDLPLSQLLQGANNLSDVASASTARTNLGLGTAATQPSSAFVATVPPPSGDTSGATDTAMLAPIVAAGGWVNLRAGTYYVNASIPVPSNTRITGAGLWATTVWQKGVTFGSAGTYYNVFQPVTGSSNIEFRDFWIQGDNNPMQALPLGNQCDGIGIAASAGCSDIRFERVGGSYLFGIAIQVTDSTSTNIELVDCWALYNGKDGLNPNINAGKITGCTMIGNAYNGIETSCVNAIVAGNYAYGNLQAGISVLGPPVTVAANVTCHDNVCLGNATGISVEGNIRQFDVHDNTCRNNTNYGISVSGSTNPSNGKVHHNTCVSNGTTAFGNGIGILIAGANIEADSNYVTDTGDTGYQQVFGIQVLGATCKIISNHSLGNHSWDYDFNGAASMVLVINDAGVNTRYRGTGVGISSGRITGAGTPLSVVPAAVGVIYQRTNGAGGTTLYVKETASGPTDVTGWTAMASLSGATVVNSIAAGDPTILIGGTSTVPTVESKGISGVTVSGTLPLAGQVLTALTSTTADWAAATGPSTSGIAYDTVTAAGDLIAGTGNATVERLGIGAAGAVLTVGGADPSGLEWSSTPVGSQVAYAKITSTVTQVLGAGTWTAVAGSPSITLPNDGNTYRIDLTGPAAQISTAANVRIAIGTSTSALLAESYQNYGGGATNYYTTNIVAQKVTGSGQTVSVYAECGAAYTLTLNVDNSCPFELAAYRVA